MFSHLAKSAGWLINLFVIVLLISSCTSAGSSRAADAVPVEPAATTPTSVDVVIDDVESTPTPLDEQSSEPSEADSAPPASTEEKSSEQVLLVRQSDGESSRMFTIRADGSGEQEFRLPAPCAPDDNGCAALNVLPSVNGRSLIVTFDHWYWYDVLTGDLTHIARVGDGRAGVLSQSRFPVASMSTDEGPMLLVVDRDTGRTLETPFDGSPQIVTELPNGVVVRDQRGPTIIVNMTSLSAATIGESLLVGQGEISADGKLVAAYERGDDGFQLVVIDVDDPLSPSPWPPMELDFAFDWTGQKLLTVSDQDGEVRLVDEFGGVELDRLWPGEFQRARSVIVDDAGAYGLVHLSTREEELWYRVDIDARHSDEVVELRGMEQSFVNVHAEQGFIWATDEVVDNLRYTRLVVVPIEPGPAVEVSTTDRPATVAVWALGDDHVFVRSFGDPQSQWIVNLDGSGRAAVAEGSEPLLNTDGSTVALTARNVLQTWVVLLPLEDPTAAERLIDGTAIAWIDAPP